MNSGGVWAIPQFIAARNRSKTRWIDAISTSSAYSESVLNRLISSGSSNPDKEMFPRCSLSTAIWLRTEPMLRSPAGFTHRSRYASRNAATVVICVFT